MPSSSATKNALGRNTTLSMHCVEETEESEGKGGRVERVPRLHAILYDLTTPKISLTKKGSSLCTKSDSGFHLPRSAASTSFSDDDNLLPA